jgi:hypothetical protein
MIVPSMNTLPWVLPIVAGALAITHMLVSDATLRIDAITLGLLVVAVLPQLLPYLESITLPDGTVVNLRKLVRETETRLDLIEKRGSLPGGSEPGPDTSRHPIPHNGSPNDDWNSDPNKGAFGGEPAANGRILEARIEPAAGPRSAACRVTLTVRSTDPSRPLVGNVELHLHPSFGKWTRYEIPVSNGRASDTITCWGVFTVGARADGGSTELELDLATVEGGTEKFYRS